MYRPSFCRRAVLFLLAWLLRFVLVTNRDIYSKSRADYVILRTQYLRELQLFGFSAAFLHPIRAGLSVASYHLTIHNQLNILYKSLF